MMALLLFSAAALCILTVWLLSSIKARRSDYLMQFSLIPSGSFDFGPKLSRRNLLQEKLLDWRYDIKKFSMYKFRPIRTNLRPIRAERNNGNRKTGSLFTHFDEPMRGRRLWDERITDVGSFGCYFKPIYTGSSGPMAYMPERRHVGLEGKLRLPKQVYERDAFNISIILDPIVRTDDESTEPDIVIRTGDEGIMILTATWPDDSKNGILIVRLVCVALEIVSTRPEEQPISLKRLAYNWNCAFLDSGEHELSLEFSIFDDTGIFSTWWYSHKVRVVKVDHLTKRQVWVLAASGGTVSFLLSVAAIVGKLI